MNRELLQKIIRIIKLLRTHDNDQEAEKFEMVSALEAELAKPDQNSVMSGCCAECGVKASDGYALYCVNCTDLFAQPEQPDLRKAAEMALDAMRLYVTMYPQMDKGYMVDARETFRQALAQPEQEPVAKYDSIELHVLHSHFAGLLYDFMGWLTSRRTRLCLSGNDNAGPAVDAIVDFAKMRGLNLQDAQVEHWQTILTTSHSANGSADSTETFGKPEQPLDKKADNARDLGLDYEVDRGFDKCNKGDICHG